MKVSWLTALTFATAALAEPVLVPEQGQHVAPDQIADLEKRQYETQAAILDTLLAAIHIQTTEIRAILHRNPGDLKGPRRKVVTGLLGLGFGRMTFAITEANSLLRQKTTDDLAREEDETGCGTHCISQKTNAIIKEMGPAIKDSLLKLGLNDLGKHIHPAFLALSGTVITLNGIVGGALVAVSALVNGLFIAIAAGIAYLGRLASDKEREQAGGPMGPKTFEISKLLEILRRFLDNNPPAPGEQ